MTEKYESLGARAGVSKIPVLRGVFAFVDSLVLGMKTLMWSASFFEDEEEDAKTSKKAKNHPKTSQEAFCAVPLRFFTQAP